DRRRDVGRPIVAERRQQEADRVEELLRLRVMVQGGEKLRDSLRPRCARKAGEQRHALEHMLKRAREDLVELRELSGNGYGGGRGPPRAGGAGACVRLPRPRAGSGGWVGRAAPAAGGVAERAGAGCPATRSMSASAAAATALAPSTAR